MAKIIKLTKNKETMLDNEDFEKFNQFKWYYSKVGYVVRDIRLNKQRKAVLLHREIIGAKENEIVDHMNGNPLDNRKENLRIATKSSNGMNRGIPINNTSGYKGVSYYKANKKWHAYISFNKKKEYIWVIFLM